jgi:hypothetical protein
MQSIDGPGWRQDRFSSRRREVERRQEPRSYPTICSTINVNDNDVIGTLSDRRVCGRWRPNVMAVISDAFHLKQRVTVTEAFGIVRSKFIGPRAF